MKSFKGKKCQLLLGRWTIFCTKITCGNCTLYNIKPVSFRFFGISFRVTRSLNSRTKLMKSLIRTIVLIYLVRSLLGLAKKSIALRNARRKA